MDADDGHRVGRDGAPGAPVPWTLRVVPPLIGLAVLVVWSGVRNHGLGLQTLVAAGVFVVLAVLVGLLGRRLERRRTDRRASRDS